LGPEVGFFIAIGLAATTFFSARFTTGAGFFTGAGVCFFAVAVWGDCI
jgi:hypothetical protein